MLPPSAAAETSLLTVESFDAPLVCPITAQVPATPFPVPLTPISEFLGYPIAVLCCTYVLMHVFIACLLAFPACLPATPLTGFGVSLINNIWFTNCKGVVCDGGCPADGRV